MNRPTSGVIVGLVLTLASTSSQAESPADQVHGIWKTETSDSGGHLEVTIGPCTSNSDKTCGIITSAYSESGADPDYENLGELIIKDMTSKNGTSFSGGTVWDPEKDKVYKSKMKLKGDHLDVEGCISFICVGQDWVRQK